MPARRGERHHFAKLTADDVRSMRRRRAAGETIDAIWLTYHNVNSRATIDHAVSGRTWRHVT